jgi:polysaccharide biosynthesis protein PslH
VLEAMAMAKAVIAAPAALAALNTEDDVHLVRASAPAEWVSAASELLANAPRRAELGRAAREYVDAHHHWERCLQPLADAVFLPASAP